MCEWGVWVSDLCVSEWCVCVWVMCVCEWVRHLVYVWCMCEWVMCVCEWVSGCECEGGQEGGQAGGGEGGRSGYSTKNKNPTRQSGEKRSWNQGINLHRYQFCSKAWMWMCRIGWHTFVCKATSQTFSETLIRWGCRLRSKPRSKEQLERKNKRSIQACRQACKRL